MTRPRVVLASGSVMILVAVIAVGAGLGSGDARLWALLCGVLGVAAALQSVLSEPKDLAPALLFSVPSVAQFVGGDSPTWLIGLLAVLLLLSAELNALSWECHGAAAAGVVKPGRLLDTVMLASLGLVASLLVQIVAQNLSLDGGRAAVVLGSLGLAGLGRIVFGAAAEGRHASRQPGLAPGHETFASRVPSYSTGRTERDPAAWEGPLT